MKFVLNILAIIVLMLSTAGVVFIKQALESHSPIGVDPLSYPPTLSTQEKSAYQHHLDKINDEQAEEDEILTDYGTNPSAVRHILRGDWQ